MCGNVILIDRATDRPGSPEEGATPHVEAFTRPVDRCEHVHGYWNPARSGGIDPPAVDTLAVDARPFNRSGHSGLDCCHFRWLDAIAGHAAKTAHLYSIVVPELEEAT